MDSKFSFKTTIGNWRGLIIKSCIYFNILYFLLLFVHFLQFFSALSYVDFRLIYYFILLVNFFTLGILGEISSKIRQLIGLMSILSVLFLLPTALDLTIFKQTIIYSWVQLFKTISPSIYPTALAIGLLGMYFSSYPIINHVRESKIIASKAQNRSKLQKTAKQQTLTVKLLRIYAKIKKHYLLEMIILVFIVIKIPFMADDFSGLNEMKYSSFVGPAREMLKHGLLWQQKKYAAIPVANPDGRWESFGSYPLMQWGLVTIFKFLPFSSIEVNARLFTLILGIILLILINKFFKLLFSRKMALLLTFLISTNPIFNYIGFLTVMDTPMLIFFLLSLLLLFEGLNKDNIRKIYLAGILGGIGVNFKLTLLIIGIPVYTALLFFTEKDQWFRKFNNSIYFFPFLILETVFFRLSFRWIPKNFSYYFSIFIFIIIFHLIFYKLITPISKKTLTISKKLKIRYYLLVGVTLLFLLYLALVKITWLQPFIKDYITDRYLLFNYSLYSKFLNDWREWLSPFGFYCGLIGFFSILSTKENSRQKAIKFSFLLSSIIFAVLCSKVLYFHIYYHHTIMITFLLFAYIYLFIVSNYIKNKYLANFFLFLTIGILSAHQINTTFRIMKRDKVKHVKKVGEYLENSVSENGFYIQETTPIIGFYSNRKSFNESVFKNEHLKKDIKKKLADGSSVGQIMDELSIEYYVTNEKEGFKKLGFWELFRENHKSDDEMSYRTKIILSKENNMPVDTQINSHELDFVFNSKVRPYLEVKKQIYDYYIYEFIHNKTD